jgi:AmmeMemoRadiSam system protein B/AmmeMemoRadiSam system protein A
MNMGFNSEVIDRPPAVAGTFYSSDRERLANDVKNLFAQGTASKNLHNINAVIAPHAGYIFSGQVAASAYNQLSPEIIYKNVFLIGSSHHMDFDGAALYCDGNFITPLGLARVNIELARKLVEDNPDTFMSRPEVHANEHSLEVQIPFLQHLYKDKLQIVPILIATQNIATIAKISDALTPFFNSQNLFVISTDFSHYPDYETAKVIDKQTAIPILDNSPSAFLLTLENNESKNVSNLSTSICGWSAVLGLLNITQSSPGIRYHQINYMNSGDSKHGDKKRVVGYHAIVMTVEQKSGAAEAQPGFMLSFEEKTRLFQIARDSIVGFLSHGKIPQIDPDGLTEKLSAYAGVFVTLYNHKNLRGCIGHFNAVNPLYKAVQEMAVSAATRDFRFPKVTKDELKHIDFEISILTPMQKIQSIEEIIPGKHGIFITKGNSSGTYLPKVAVHMGWTVEEFLGHCARDKAGLGWDGWKDAEIFVYEAYVIYETKV